MLEQCNFTTKAAERMTNSIDLDQKELSDLSLYFLLEQCNFTTKAAE